MIGDAGSAGLYLEIVYYITIDIYGYLLFFFFYIRVSSCILTNIDVRIQEGEIVGFIDPNGAGKSTTIKMLTGILQPDRGSVTVNGIVPGENRVQNALNIGVVFGQRSQLWWDIPVKDTLHLMKHMYHIPDRVYEENLVLYSEILGLKEFMNQPVRQLSLGQRMRADIACAILHGPKVLYLDEPTIGLDIFVKESVRKFVKEINEQKKTTVLLTTHDMTDIEKLCSRVMVIDKGTIIYEGSLENLKEKYGYHEAVEARGSWGAENIINITTLPTVFVEKAADKLLVHYDRYLVSVIGIHRNVSVFFTVLLSGTDQLLVGTDLDFGAVFERFYQSVFGKDDTGAAVSGFLVKYQQLHAFSIYLGAHYLGDHRLCDCVPACIYRIREFINYPISIYSTGIQVFLTIIVPYG